LELLGILVELFELKAGIDEINRINKKIFRTKGNLDSYIGPDYILKAISGKNALFTFIMKLKIKSAYGSALKQCKQVV
jgi:hypothetical protein